MRWRVGALALALSLTAGAACGEVINCNGIGSWGELSEIRLMRVAATEPRVNFISGTRAIADKGCPSADAACREKSYLVAGNDVLAGESVGDFICVTYRAPRGRETSGFLPRTALAGVKRAAPKLFDWTGKWTRDFEAELTIRPLRGKLAVSGSATWGAGDPQRVKNGGVHTGGLEGEGAPKGNLLGLGENYDGTGPLDTDDRSDCKARLRLFGRYLVVEDNRGCGGANVSFLGVYLK